MYRYIRTYLCTEYIIYELCALFLFCFTLGKTSLFKQNKTKILTHEENYYFGQNSIFISNNFYFKSKLVKSIFYIFIVKSYFRSKIIEYRCATQMCDKGVSLFFKLIRYEKYCCKLWSLKLLLKRIVRSLGVIFDFVMYIVKSKEFEVLHRSGSFFKNCKILDQ